MDEDIIEVIEFVKIERDVTHDLMQVIIGMFAVNCFIMAIIVVVFVLI